MKNFIDNWKTNAKKKVANTSKNLNTLKQINKAELNTIANKCDEIVFKNLDCLDCANCCKNLPALVNQADIKRIAKHLNIKESDFRKKYLTKDEDDDFVTKSKPCPFLQNDNKCKIYEVRPQSCRDYPITGNNLFADNTNLHLTNSIHCPAVFEIINKMYEKVDF